MLSRVSLLFLLLTASGCATSIPVTAAGVPRDAEVRRASLDLLGSSLFQALRDGDVSHTLARGYELDSLVNHESRLRITRERRGQRVPSVFKTWGGASYVGFCAQGARDEPARNGLGLLKPAWVLERILVAARDGLGRSAAWIEGRFVYTDRGWRTLSLTQIEPPRRQHSDLDLAPCDVEAGIR